MQRRDQEITDRTEIESILQRATVCRIAMAEDNVPYVVPVSFGYRDGCLYIHSAPEGRKIDILKRNDRVCFEVDVDEELVRRGEPCAWSMRYRSVVGLGRAYLVEDAEEKRKALDIIVEHYGGEPAGYSDKALREVAVIRVKIEEMTGKQSGHINS